MPELPKKCKPPSNEYVICPNKYTSKVIEYCFFLQFPRVWFEKPSLWCQNEWAYHLSYRSEYLKFTVMKKPTKSSPIFLTISYFKMGYPGVYDEPMLQTEISPELYEKIINDPNAPQVLKDVLLAMPKEKDEWAMVPFYKGYDCCYYPNDCIEVIKNYLESISG